MIISRAPVRLSMGGGGTDLPSYYQKHEGFLMAATINRFIYVSASKRFYESIRLSYSKTEIVDRVDQIEHPIFREALKLVGIEKQIELVSVADVPAQCGLGSSSVFTVALLHALNTYLKRHVERQELARLANHLEMVVLAQPIGKQDHYAAACGGFNAYWFCRDGSVKVEPVAIAEDRLMQLQNNILLFHLKKERPASVILSEQNKRSLAGDPEVIDRLHKIKQIGLRTREIFERGHIDEFGEILHEHWLTKKGLASAISDPFIDEVYDAARKNGALGGKVVGAGGGGFLLVYCPTDKQKLVETMAKFGLAPMWFAFEHEGAEVVFHS